MFFATEAGMLRQEAALTQRNGVAPRRLTSDRDVLEALLALELGRDVVASVRSVATGWRLPEGVKIGFDAELDGEENAGLRAQCLARGAPIAPAPGLSPFSLGPDDRALPMLGVRVTDPFESPEPEQAEPEAA